MSADIEPAVIAIDPGSDKCGVAVVRRSGHVLHRAIVVTGELVQAVQALLTDYRPVHIVCGRGTGSKPILRSLIAAELGVTVEPVDENFTSEQARRRWVAENPARGLARLLPRGLRTPSVPYDDYVAVILGERFWTSRAGESVN